MKQPLGRGDLYLLQARRGHALDSFRQLALFGLGAADPATLALVPLTLLLVALAACLGPGLKASRAAIDGAAARSF
jgi:hypothetical protein